MSNRYDQLHILIADIKSWFKRKTSLRLNDGAAPEEFQRLKKAVDQSVPEVPSHAQLQIYSFF
jgi:hypothetical protein